MFRVPPKIPPLKIILQTLYAAKTNLYGIVLVHIMHKTALNTTKHLQVARYKFFKNRRKLQL